MTAFHVSTYLQMGNDFDSRNRFLKHRADGSFEGCVVGGNGEAWSANATLISATIIISLIFKMGNYQLVAQNYTTAPAPTPSGTTTFVSSE